MHILFQNCSKKNFFGLLIFLVSFAANFSKANETVLNRNTSLSSSSAAINDAISKPPPNFMTIVQELFRQNKNSYLGKGDVKLPQFVDGFKLSDYLSKSNQTINKENLELSYCLSVVTIYTADIPELYSTGVPRQDRDFFEKALNPVCWRIKNYLALVSSATLLKPNSLQIQNSVINMLDIQFMQTVTSPLYADFLAYHKQNIQYKKSVLGKLGISLNNVLIFLNFTIIAAILLFTLSILFSIKLKRNA